MRDILAWIATVEVLGLAALPILRAFFGNRRDAALLSRPIGLALVAYFGWAFTLLPRFPFRRGLLLFALALVAALSYFVSRRGAERDARFWGNEETRAALFFWAAAGVFLLIRAAAPEVNGQEKFMDLAFFNSITRHDAMPPLDPWMAGKTINYYYWGYLLAAVLAKISTVTPYVSYNLALATFAGYSFVAAVCLGLRLSAGRLAAGVGAGLATVFAGNLQGALDAWKAPFDAGFDYFHASRVIGAGNTINEFPFFTFFHADLHPHLLAFPYFLAAFAVAHRWVEMGRTAPSEKPGGAKDLFRRAAPALLVVLVAGTAMVANKWNTPAMGVLLAFAGAARSTEGKRLPSAPDLFRGGVFGALLFVLALLLWGPYSGSYSLPYNGIGRTSESSGFFEFLGVWGILFLVAYAALLRHGEAAGARRRDGLLFVGVLALSWLLALFWKATPWKTSIPVLVLLLPLAYLAARVGWEALRGEEGALVFASFLLLLSLTILVGCELVHFKDSYGQQLHRMNTIFKFYMQAWPLLAVAAAVFAERAWRAWGRESRTFRAALALAAFSALLYPLNTAVSRLRQRQAAFSLDARGPLQRRSPGDAAAIAWLEKNAPRGSVLLEAAGNPYSDYARVSSHTGIPTVLGWANHEGLWRGNDPEVGQRESSIRAFYSAPDPQSAFALLQRYGVTHVVVGPLERATYPSASEVALYPFLQAAHSGDTAVYRVFGAR